MSVQPLFDRDSLVSAQQSCMSLASLGNCKALALLALITHHLQPPRETVSSEALNFLRRAMESADAEFLVELGEELIIGCPYFRDIRLAEECFKLAYAVSEIKGAYALGRFAAGSNKTSALKFFRRAGSLGHFPSEVLADVGFERAANPVIKLVKVLALGLGQGRRIEKALRSSDVKMRFWRYRDDLAQIQSLQDAVGVDRVSTFPWSTPISIMTLTSSLKGIDNSILNLRRAHIRSGFIVPNAFFAA